LNAVDYNNLFRPVESNLPAVYSLEDAICLFDADSDGDLDVVLAGRSYQGYIAELFVNDGTGTFTAANAGFEPSGGGCAVADVNNDGATDVLLTGDGRPGGTERERPGTRLYLNDGTGTFRAKSTELPPVKEGTADFGDIDNDGDADLFLTGYMPTGLTYLDIGRFEEHRFIARFYMNDGRGNFTIQRDGFRGVNNSAAALADFDADGYLDVLFTGAADDPENMHWYMKVAYLYSNDRRGRFDSSSHELQAVSAGGIEVADFDGDRAPDVLMYGIANRYGPAGYPATIFRGDNRKHFKPWVSLTPLFFGDAAVGDIDNDGDQDILLVGRESNEPYHRYARLFVNEGDGAFREEATGVTPIEKSSAHFADLDNDGDLDLLMTGADWEGLTRWTLVYENTLQ